MSRTLAGSYPASAVVHAIATATRYRADQSADPEQVASSAHRLTRSLRPGGLLDDPSLQGFRREVAAAVSATPTPDVPSLVESLVDAGLVDAVGHYFYRSLSLTPEGVAHALEVRPLFAPQNLTVEWFDRFLTREQYDRLVRHVASKTKHSRDDSEVRGFVHGYVLSMGKNDGLRARILADNDPTPGSIRAWVWKHALSTFRNEGTDAQTRTVKGSRTEREVRGEAPLDVFAAPEAASTVVYAVEGGGEDDAGTFASSSASSGHALLDVIDTDPTPEDVLAHSEALRRGMERFEAAVRADKPGAADRYARVLGHLARGMSPAEVAQAEGVSPARAATLIAEVRESGRRRADLDRVRGEVVRYLDSEPMSTVADMVDDLTVDVTRIRTAVSELLSEGVLVWRKGGSLRVADGVVLDVPEM